MDKALDARKLVAELLGTGILVFFGAGAALLSFGFGVTGSSAAAGTALTGIIFGLVLLALVYAIGDISGCHVNPAVTLAFVASRRMGIVEAVGYWVAQVVGGIIGALVLWGVASLAPTYKSGMGLGADGYGALSMVKLGAGGAFLLEVVLTFLFVLVVLAVTRNAKNALIAGIPIGWALGLVNLMGIPFDGTSVNPARSIGPALFSGTDAMSQLWLFIIAPLVGGVIAALAYRFFYGHEGEATAEATVGAAEQPDIAG
ncbi:MAG: aquaporin [Marmoricola sp.]